MDDAPFLVVRGENDLLFCERNKTHIDLFSGHGVAWLGHANKTIAQAIAAQMERVWTTGGLETAIQRKAKAMIESFFPSTHVLAGLYSTGMEAAEFAMRIARVATTKNGVVGFERSMHGKSLATAYLGWDNGDHLKLPHFHRLPFVRSHSEQEIIKRLTELLTTKPISAVFVEPLQATGGGSMASKHFYQKLMDLCGKANALLIFDEILTGFYRTGRPFFFSGLGFTPDIVLIGKAMGNGFPVSGVVANKKYGIKTDMLPGSTYAGNPLASAAVVATLRRLRSMNVRPKVASIAKTVTDILDTQNRIGIRLRGKGALWVIELPEAWNIERIVAGVYKRGVFVSYTGHQIRILPAATIKKSNLVKACQVVRGELLKAHYAR